MKLSEEGLQLILDGEVGGGRPYYDRFCKSPAVPDPKNTDSGITIGIGWDCGQHTRDDLEREWQGYLSDDSIEALKGVCGLRRMKAVSALAGVRDLEVPWDVALAQFMACTVPRHWSNTCLAFPGVENAPHGVREALLSLVFNRGASMSGDRRREMREIRELVAAGNWAEIPSRILEMKRLWPNTKGLLIRREAEARHIEASLRSPDD